MFTLQFVHTRRNMGNITTAVAANQILPVETFINDVQTMRFIKSLGNTRFMKVARADHVDGTVTPVVLKVFVPHEDDFLVGRYVEQVQQVRDVLCTAYNCLPFSNIFVTVRCAILCRKYRKEILYSRMSTRPFLLDIEKKWITFQLLKALAQCEAVDVCHGDLKSQNVLISGSNWVQITDFATFKPAFIASDDPSYFTFFFDTGRKGTCYIAPERFYPSHQIKLYTDVPKQFLDISKGLTHAMDVFSLGCVLVELNSTFEEYCPFNYRGLIRYKEMSNEEAENVVQDIVAKVPHELREMIAIMLNRIPSKRSTATKLLHDLGPQLFSPIFEELYHYLCNSPLYSDSYNIAAEAGDRSSSSQDFDDIISKVAQDIWSIFQRNRTKSPNAENEEELSSVVLFITLITSSMRGLKSTAMKLTSMEILQRFASFADGSVVSDRILPYLIILLYDASVQVRSVAIDKITVILSSLKDIPIRETRLFIDYVFPHMKIVSTDPSTLVQMGLAENLGLLSETSVRFLTQGSKNLTNDILAHSVVQEALEKEDWETEIARQELLALFNAVNEIFVNICGSENCVKHCLVSSQSFVSLCRFFNRQKSADVLLSHMITFLNDKVDWRLRAAFFQCCPIPARFVGRQSSFILRSLLQQGIHDFEEFVQLHAIWCICTLCQYQLLDKAAIFDLLHDVLPFLCHPNEWLRLAVISILVTLDGALNVADMHCKLLPLVRPYLTENLIKLNNKFIITTTLRSPIGRAVWDFITTECPLIPILDYLAEKQMYMALEGGPNSIFAANRNICASNYEIELCLKRLEVHGMNNDTEEKITRFSHILRKMDSFRASMADIRSVPKRGAVDLSMLADVLPRKFDLTSPLPIHENAEYNEIDPNNIRDRDPPEVMLFDELNYFKFSDSLYTSKQLESDRHMGASSNLIAPSPSCANSMSKLFLYMRHCYLRKLQMHKNDVRKSGRKIILNESTLSRCQQIGTQFVSQICAHKQMLNKIVLNAPETHFVSAGCDGYIKLWSVGRILSKRVGTIVPEGTFSYGCEINSVDFLGMGDRLAIATVDSRVCILDTKRLSLITTMNFSKSECGAAMELIAADNLLFVRTFHSSILCFDCRMPQSCKFGLKPAPIWQHKIKDAYGLITSFCIDPTNRYWMCMTSTNRNSILWDLRFGLEVNNWPHPSNKCRMLRCWPALNLVNPSAPCNEVWTSSSCCGELSRWNLETAQRSHVIWPNPNRHALCYVEDHFKSTALVTCPISSRIFTGDCRGAIRSFNLNTPYECFYLSGPLRQTEDRICASGSLQNDIHYSTQVVDDVNVLCEFASDSHGKSFFERSQRMQPEIFHKSAIMDLLHTGELLISASRDGFINIWK